MRKPARYMGRFAPSPTGPLHVGSLIAALASACDARSKAGLWSLRIDDIDPPREVAGAADGILRTLERYQFSWDDVLYQSTRHEAYRHALHQLDELGLLYRCTCSRKKLAGARIYPGNCTPPNLSNPASYPSPARSCHGDINTGSDEFSLRLHLHGHALLNDRIQGMMRVDLASNIGDIVVRRRGGFDAYALACAIDDASGHVSDVVRGADLMPTTTAQLAIMKLLGLPAPRYAHVPMAMHHSTGKLSKQTHARALDSLPVLDSLMQAWKFLGQIPTAVDSITDFWAIAPSLWDIDRVPKVLELPDPTTPLSR